MSKPLKSPLRYPGGKSRALKQIESQLPLSVLGGAGKAEPEGREEGAGGEVLEYREPFIGGGSVYLAARSWFPCPERGYWINDINPHVAAFWQTMHADPTRCMEMSIKDYKANWKNGRGLYKHCLAGLSLPKSAEWERATWFFVLNRITFSGLSESGGYSERAFRERFTTSSIDRLTALRGHLTNTRITSQDFEQVVSAPGDGVFIFLDPPYMRQGGSKLYGRNGDLHVGFDHHRLAATLKATPHKWLMTYDDSPGVRELYQDWAHIVPWQLQYGMNNYKQGSAAKGDELFIRNY
jgi:DNA adenine methylase